MTENQSKTIRKLIQRSDNGDFSASFQLSQAFLEGFSVEKSKDKASFYKIRCSEQLENSEFKISSIKINNYKGFESLDLDFSKTGKTTILVGNNGCGKSTVLEAIQKCLTHLSSRLSTKSNNGDLIDEIEIKEGSDTSTIHATFEMNKCLVNMSLAQSRALSAVKTKGSYVDINEISQIIRLANDANPSISLPLFASYNVERANDVTTKDIENSDEIIDHHIWDKAKGYSKSLSGKADFKLFFRWFQELVEKENQEVTDNNEIKVKITAKESEINSPILKDLIKKHPDLSSLLDSHRKELIDLKKQLNSLANVNDKSLDAVKEAIYKFLPGFSQLKFVRSPLDLTIEKKGVILSVLQLSQGEKSILALVADIARRLTLLNPETIVPLEGTGIVLIDEIDLHLHPSWQQRIIKKLESVFPNIQFIVTTHSPQVCHTVHSNSIWLLKDGNKYRAPKGIQGAVSSWVLKNLFEVDERPPEDKYTVKLFEYRQLVYQDKYDGEQAILLRKKLSENFGSSYEFLVELDLYIENRKWEKEYEKG